MKLKLPQITPSFLLFVMTFALTAGACHCLRVWWQAFSLALITAFVLFAQEAISRFFQTNTKDIWIKLTVFLVAVGYGTMFYFCVFTKNEMAGGELIGGFTLFLRKLLKEVMDDTALIAPVDNII